MERAAETHVQLVTPAGTLIADVALRPDDTLHELYRLGCANSSFDSTCVLRFQLLDAHANPLQHDGLVRDNVKDGDSVTFVAIARDWMGAVKRNPATLRCAPQFARADPLVVLEAVRQRGAVLAYAAPELQDKREVVFAAVSTDGLALEFASAKLRDDKEIVLAAVCHQGPALRFASERLRSDREVVTCACVNDGNSLEYAMNWRRDKAMVLLAVDRHQALDRQPRSPIQFAAPELLGNYDFMWQAAQLDRCCVDFAAADIRPVLRTALEESLDKDHGFLQMKVPLTELKFRSERSTAPGAEDSESESDGDGSVYSI